MKSRNGGVCPSKLGECGGEHETNDHRQEADTEENDSKADEMLLKRCAYHGLNFAAPFIVMRCFNMSSEGSARSKTSRLLRDHLIVKVREEKGTAKALFRKTGTIIL